MKTKIVFFGLAGASWPVIDYLIENKKLPVLKKLIDNGKRSNLYNVNTLWKYPLQMFGDYRGYKKILVNSWNHSDVMDWTTVATGLMPYQHGLYSSTEEDIRKIKVPASLRKRKTLAIWEELALHHHKNIGIIGWPANWPPPDFKYYTAARLNDVFSPFSQQKINYNGAHFSSDNGCFRCAPVYPQRLWKTLKGINYDTEINKFIKNIIPFISGRGLIYDSLYLEWTKYLLNKFPQPDFLAVCLDEIHNLSHLFWDCLEIEKDNFKGIIHQRRRRKFGSIIEDYYQYLDKKIGEILNLIDKNSIVIIISPYGMRKETLYKKYILMNKVYEKLGLLTFNNGKIDWDNTYVYDDMNPWGILAQRKGFIKGKFSKKIQYLKELLKEIEDEDGNPIFLDTNFSQKDNSFTVTPNYRVINRSKKIILKNKSFPVKEFVKFIPHYSIHHYEGILIISGENIKGAEFNNSIITTLDIVPTLFNILGIKTKNGLFGKTAVKL